MLVQMESARPMTDSSSCVEIAQGLRLSSRKLSFFFFFFFFFCFFFLLLKSTFFFKYVQCQQLYVFFVIHASLMFGPSRIIRTFWP